MSRDSVVRIDGIPLVPRSGDIENPLPLPQSLYGRSLARSYADIITKFSRLDGLPIFLTHGASLACFARRSSAINIQNSCQYELGNRFASWRWVL